MKQPSSAVIQLGALGALGWCRRLCERASVTLADILGRSRVSRIVRVRHRVWAVLRWTLELSYPEIGRIWGVDHSTVMAGVRQHERRLAAEVA
jgi:chromosomal replication initiation ATPase DnaA